MTSEKLDSFEPGDGDPAAGLESHLHRLDLASNSLNDEQSSPNPQPDRPTSDPRSSHGASPGPSPITSRRRPNQAQRRQMSSQLSIPIDPRPQQPSHLANPGVGHNDQHYRPPRSDQRHSQAASRSSWTRNAGPLNRNSSWNTSSPNSSINLAWNSPQGSYNRQAQSQSFQQYPTPAQPPRHGFGSFQAQRRYCSRAEDVASQAGFLERICYRVISQSEIEVSEIAEKEEFRQRIEGICRDVISRHEQQQEDKAREFTASTVELKCFGSLSSGFATKASDMDLGLLSPMSTPQPDTAESPIPRLLEKAFLDAGLGARLLSRTRVPIIKLCQEPPECLRQALLAERQKWESGGTKEMADDEDFEQDIMSQGTGLDAFDPRRQDVYLLSLTELSDSCAESGPAGRFRLQQGANHTLSAYYGLAKRVLRRAGGRDVTITNRHEFTASDWSILDGVCEAFVQGLSDPLLRERLTRYPSLSFQPLCNMSSHRSLHGVITQVEGEQIIQRWETWSAQEIVYDVQPQTQQILSTWADIQWRSDFGVDPVSYTKDLQLGLDKVKRIPSVQLIMLEQGQHEAPMQYYMRAKAILTSLRHELRSLSSAVHQTFISRYVSGITQNDVREILTNMIDNHNSQVEFEAVALWHKILHLSRQMEAALEKGTFNVSQTTDITEYIALLQSPPRKVFTGPVDYRFIIPVLPGSMGLVMRIRELGGLLHLASNQPRDRYRDPLEFPTTGAGVQCDINFSAHLALHNTALLRCYSHTDARVRPMVLFVKHWAKVRGINSGYRGTLSSYGYVLMVLHYLVNVAKPFVCPNLQQLAPSRSLNPSSAEVETVLSCRGFDVQFWRNEEEILHLAAANQLNCNFESIGHLLRGFFEYFAHNGIMSCGLGKGFDWGREVLSLRTQGGLLTKQEKRWTGAKTVLEFQGSSAVPNPQTEQGSGLASGRESRTAASNSRDKSGQQPPMGGEVKEIRHRYLFAIEDPFELDHNVARTVTHNGIVSIRDEFRRAWQIIRSVDGDSAQEDLLGDVKDAQENLNPFLRLLDDIHLLQGAWPAVQ